MRNPKRMVQHRLRRKSLGISPVTVDVPDNQREVVIASIAIMREEYMYEVALMPATLLPVVTALATMRKAQKLPTDRDLIALTKMLGADYSEFTGNAREALKKFRLESSRVAAAVEEGGAGSTRQVARAVTATRVASAHINYLKAVVKNKLPDYNMLGSIGETVFGVVE